MSKTKYALGLVIAVMAVIMSPSRQHAIQAEKIEPYQIQTPGLKLICAKESTGDFTKEPQQFDQKGEPIKGYNRKNGIITSVDWGACQINDKTWDATAKRLGLDYKNSIEDNYRLADYIAQNDSRGLKNWTTYDSFRRFKLSSMSYVQEPK